MPHYLLSVHTDSTAPSEPMSEEDMQAMMTRVNELEADMRSSGTYVFGGALHDHDSTTVVSMNDGDVLNTDGPFAEAKEHIAGFYVIDADDLDAALEWAAKVTDTVRRPIEVRPFRHSDLA